MILSIPLNTSLARVLKKLQEQQMKNRDHRTRLMNELLANIKRYSFVFPMLKNTDHGSSIKLYAWEYAFTRRILHVRNDLELRNLKRIGIFQVGFEFSRVIPSLFLVRL